jgi:apolipoprotein N-acyltransferase
MVTVSSLHFLMFYIIYKRKYSPLKISFFIFLIVYFSSYVRNFLMNSFYYSPIFKSGNYWYFGEPALNFTYTKYNLLLKFLDIRLASSLLCVSLFFIIYLNIKHKHKIILKAVFLSILIFSIFPNEIKLDFNEFSYGTKKISKEISIKIYEKGVIIKKPKNPDIYIYPEDYNFSNYEKSEAVKNKRISIYNKIIDTENGKKISSVYKFLENVDKKYSEEVQISDKQFIMPYGEYIPTISKYLSYAFLSWDKADYLDSERSFMSGEIKTSVQNINGSNFIFLLCSDAWTFETLKISNKKNIDYVVILESNTIFNDNKWFLTHLYSWHYLTHLQSNKTIISVPKTGPAWVIQ